MKRRRFISDGLFAAAALAGAATWHAAAWRKVKQVKGDGCPVHLAGKVAVPRENPPPMPGAVAVPVAGDVAAPSPCTRLGGEVAPPPQRGR